MHNHELKIKGARVPGDELIFTNEALHFIQNLARLFTKQIHTFRERRHQKQNDYDQGCLPDFDPVTESIRKGKWKIDPVPPDLQRRTVEITGPVDRKMIINALNSEADVFMADFEDSCSPTWENVISGQINLYDAVRKQIDYVHPKTKKKYKLNENAATLFVRPRGIHLDERHVTLGKEFIPASLFDFGLFFFHNAKELVSRNTGPYFYLPKLQDHPEAKLWNDIFLYAQVCLGIPQGTIKATVLIETLPAAFQMNEILYELKHHSAGLNCGRWDYIFSYIKTLKEHSDRILPDRDEVTMEAPFMKAYTQLLVKTCHSRGAHAMGGMAAQIPIKKDPIKNEAAIAKVRADKFREANGFHDGTWVAHPGLISVARNAFESVNYKAPNQLTVIPNVTVTQKDLLSVPKGMISDAGLRKNIRVAVQYLEAWLWGNGCVPLYNLMEDAATAEISRTQVWQWIRHGVKDDSNKAVTVQRVEETIREELEVIRSEIGDSRFGAGKFKKAAKIFFELVNDTKQFTEFLTLPAYEILCSV